MIKCINATPESGKDFYLKFHQKGKVVMYNLLKYKLKDDYSNLETLNLNDEITSKETAVLKRPHILFA